MYAYFGCPDTSNAAEYYCCGLPTEQYCCTQSEYSAQTTSHWPWGNLLLAVLIICVLLLGLYQTLRNAYYRRLALRGQVLVAGTAAYAVPAEQVQVAVVTTAGVEDNRGAAAGAGPAPDGQPPSAATQGLAGASGPPPYPSAAPPTYPYVGAGVPTYSTPGTGVTTSPGVATYPGVTTYPTPGGYAPVPSGTSYPTSYGAGITAPPTYPQ